MKTTEIMNKMWKVKDLQIIASTQKIKSLIEDYNKDKNCLAYDWIVGINLTEIEKASFIYSALN